MVRRLQIMIDEDLDEALARQARDEGTSRLRSSAGTSGNASSRCRRSRKTRSGRSSEWIEGSPDDSMSVNEVVYGPKRGRDLRRHVVLGRVDGAVRSLASEAVSLFRQLRRRPTPTSNHVRGETWTFLRRRRGHRSAVNLLDQVDRTAKLTVAFVSEESKARRCAGCAGTTSASTPSSMRPASLSCGH